MSVTIAVLGAGFIGRNLLRSLAHSGYEVRVLDRNRCPDEFRSAVHWHTGLFEREQDVVAAIAGADVVFHLISSTVPADQIDETSEVMANVVRTINLLHLCVQHQIGRVIFISSASVYGSAVVLPTAETSPTNPISSHGIHKLTIEKYLGLFNYKYGLDTKIMRLSNPYGFGQNPLGRQGFIGIAVGAVLSGRPVRVNGDGSAVRDYIHIDDVVRACHLLVHTDSDEALFNIGTGIGVTINDVLERLRVETGRSVDVIYGDSLVGDIQASVLDVSKARRILSFEPSVSFDDGLRAYLRRMALDSHITFRLKTDR